MRRCLLSSFAAASFACALFVAILWCRSYGLGEAIQWRMTRWPDRDQRIARVLALLTRDGGLTLAYQFDDRRVRYRSILTRDERDPGRTTFHWDANAYMEPPTLEAGFFNRLGFSKHAESQMLPPGRSRASAQAVYRWSLPFWFLTFILLLPSGYWLCRRNSVGLPATRLPAPSPPCHGEIA